jgi:hypothetical protein
LLLYHPASSSLKCSCTLSLISFALSSLPFRGWKTGVHFSSVPIVRVIVAFETQTTSGGTENDPIGDDRRIYSLCLATLIIYSRHQSVGSPIGFRVASIPACGTHT